MEKATGDLYLPIDADDRQASDAMAFYVKKWLSIPSEERRKFSGINALAGDVNCNPLGDIYPKDGFETDQFELKYKLKLKGEKCGVVRVDLMKARKYPTMRNSHYPEDYMWLYFAKYYKLKCYNKVNKIYYQEQTSIMHNKRRKFTVNALLVKAFYNSWLVRNFGLRLALCNPKALIYAMLQILGCPILAFMKSICK